MYYEEFCARAKAMLANHPALTGLRVGGGHVMLDEDANFIAVADGQPVDNSVDVDESNWNGEAFDGMTPAQIEQALAKPEFFQHAPAQGDEFDAPILNAKYADTIMVGNSDAYLSLSVVGMRDLNADIEGEGTQFEVNFDNPQIYSVYIHPKGLDGLALGSECVGDMATHELAVDYARELSAKFNLPIEDLSKVAFLVKESERKSMAEAQGIAAQKGSFSDLNPKIDQTHFGKVIGVTAAHVVLSLGRSAAVVAQSDLSRVPALGENVSLVFKGGKGLVSDCAINKATTLGR